jgi:serine/threonine protein kinase
MSDRITLGRYEIIEEIGRGGSGIVYRAYDSDRDQIVALKIMHPRLVNEPEFIERFRQEAELSATIKSVHLVPTYDYGEIEGRLYISMELMEGGSLKNRIEQDGPYSPQDAILVIHQICIGLSEIHKLDIIHRDLKPGNILFDKEDKVKISDLGFAKILDAATSLSKTGEVIGTPSYMSPEIWGGGNVTARADIYSLACIVAEMLTGNVLFDGESTPEIMLLHYQPAKLPYDLPAKWRTALIRALAIDAEQRHESVNAFYDELKKASMPEVTEKGKPSFQTRPVLGSDKPTPLPSRPLFEPGKPSQTSTSATPSQPGIPISRTIQQQEQPGPRPPIFRHQPPIPPAQAPQTSPQTPPSGQTIPTKEQNTPSPAVPIFTPIQRTPQNAFKPSKTETDPAQQGASAIPVFQPIRSGFTPKPSVPRPMPPPLEPNHQTPMPTPRPFNTPGIVPPMPEMDSNSDKPKKKKKESRRERRKREKAQSQQTFKPLFDQEAPFTAEAVTPGMAHVTSAEVPGSPSANDSDIPSETGFPEMAAQEAIETSPQKSKNKKLNLVLGIVAVLLLAGVVFFSWFLINENKAQNRLYAARTQTVQAQTGATKTAQHITQSAIYATETIAAQRTSTKAAQQTSTAVSQKTATAVYKQTATVRSIRQIPNQFVEQSAITSATTVPFDYEDSYLETYRPAGYRDYKDFSFSVNFHNPESLFDDECWHHIIGFRHIGGNDQYRFRFYPKSGYWEFENWLGSSDDIVEISSGNSSRISGKAGAINRVQLIANGNTGFVFINDVYISKLDLGARDNEGDIWIATQYCDAERHGYKTEYSGMELYAPK